MREGVALGTEVVRGVATRWRSTRCEGNGGREEGVPSQRLAIICMSFEDGQGDLEEHRQNATPKLGGFGLWILPTSARQGSDAVRAGTRAVAETRRGNENSAAENHVTPYASEGVVSDALCPLFFFLVQYLEAVMRMLRSPLLIWSLAL